MSKQTGMGCGGWKPTKVLQMNGETVARELPAEHQVITEAWNREVRIPYTVYMPERKELLMLVVVDCPHMAALMRSRDFGATWTKPEFLRTDSQGNPNIGLALGLTYLGEGKLLLYEAAQPPNEDDLRWFSRDYGKTWGDTVFVQPASDKKPWHRWDPALVERDPATGKIKRLVETGYTFKDRTVQPAGKLQSQGFIHFSRDCGLTWSNDIRVPQWRRINEIALCRSGNDTLVAACRTDNLEQYSNENDEYSGLVVSLSKDDGYTWTEVKVLYGYGRHHPCMVLLPGGDIVMTYVVRFGYPHDENGFSQFGIEAVVSRDDGESWDLEHRYILEKWKGNVTLDSPEWPRYYASPQNTSTVLLPDGLLLTAFGTGYRSQPSPGGRAAPHDVGLIRWRPDPI